jgi:hypothetical protein
MNNQPEIEVGILVRDKLEFKLDCDFLSEKRKNYLQENILHFVKNNQIIIRTVSGEKISEITETFA